MSNSGAKLSPSLLLLKIYLLKLILSHPPCFTRTFPPLVALVCAVRVHLYRRLWPQEVGVLLRLPLLILFYLIFPFIFLTPKNKFAVDDHCVKPKLPSPCASDAIKSFFFFFKEKSLKALKGSTCTQYTATYHDAEVVENVDFFPYFELIEILFLSLLSFQEIFTSKDLAEKVSIHCTHTLYTISD